MRVLKGFYLYYDPKFHEIQLLLKYDDGTEEVKTEMVVDKKEWLFYHEIPKWYE